MFLPAGLGRLGPSLVAVLLAPVAVRADAETLHQTIDSRIQAAWEREKVKPARPATDAEFLRRVSLDLIGEVPTYEETVAFLDDNDAGKRERLVDKLIADVRFARHQADVWDMVLFGRRPPGFETDKRDGFRTWLASKFEKNTPYDQWARDLLKAEGDSVDGGAMYLVQYRSAPEDAIEAISQTFLGVQLQCSRCHNHPYEKWKQKEFFGMAAFLARLEVVQVGKKGNLNVYAIGEKNSGDVKFTGPAKDARPGDKGEPVKPKFLLGDELNEPPLPKDFKEVKFVNNQPPPKPKFSRKDALADWITRADNPFFARAIANRLWAQFMGRGLVHPVDNLSPSNVPSHPELLDALAKKIVAHNFDLKWLIREVVTSRTYQLSAAGTGEALPQWFQHARSRPLSAEELIESWRIVTGYAASEKTSGKKTDTNRFRPFGEYMVHFFGAPNTGTGDFQGGLHEHLYMNNGPLSQMIGVKGGIAEYVADAKKPMAERVERLFLTTLNRRPTAEEAKKFAAFLEGKNSPGDAVWALITSSEFRFNH
ncbi:MAG TPA: DUF1549 and DUF1553 domain-containing protein [Gemmataceae bacterium]|jgi:hypothetical protein|nr:DUF1549 and DUF1553 domain-containing protein [Gemmataceae bacterium]